MKILDNTSWDFENSYKQLSEKYKDRLIIDKSLDSLTTLGIGGPARLFIEVTSILEMADIIRTSDEFKIPTFILGGGSNLLVSDKGFNGLVVKNSILGFKRSGNKITSGTGERLEDLIYFASENGLSGLEFAFGIWGTVGGAIFGNAGAYGGEIKDVLESVELVDRQGSINTVMAADMEFSYRSSKMKRSGEIAATAIFALKPGKKNKILGKMEQILAERRKKLPYEKKTAGCFFKNIPDEKEKFGKLAAGKLLDEIGAKGFRVGDASVYENHANIVINAGTAKSEDVRKLTDLMKKRVFEKFGIELEEEIVLLGSF